MTKTVMTTTCDFCGCEIDRPPFNFKTLLVNFKILLGVGVRLKVQSGLIGKWERYDLCDKCYHRMVKFCKEGAKEDNNGK